MAALLKRAYASWKTHEGAKMGASLAYYAVLSLAPLVIIVIAIAGLVFGRDAARQGLITQVQALVGPDGASMINTMTASAQKPSSGILGTVIGLATLLFGASGVFSELRDSLNKIWEVKSTPGSGVWAMIRERFLTFGMVLGIGFLLLVSLLLSAALAAFGELFGNSLPLPAFVLEGANMLISILVITLLFAAIYRFLPVERLPWSDLWIGSFGTALLFVLGKFLLGLYLGHASVGSAYGAAGSLIVLLVWIYYTAQLFFFGAEFTRAYSQNHGSRKTVPAPAVAKVLPRPEAVAVYLEDPKSAAVTGRSNVFGLVLSVALVGISYWRARYRP
jgi:membrane protein